MVSYGVSSMFFHEYTVAEIFSFVSQARLDTVEFWPETPEFWLHGLPVDDVIAAEGKNPGVSTLNIHAPVLDLNPCSINPDVADLSIAWAIRTLRIAEQLGARALTIHPGRRTAKRPPSHADFARFDHYLSIVRQESEDSPVQIAIENMEPAVNSLLCTPERMREVLDREPWLFFTLDTSHAGTTGEKTVTGYIDLCGDRLINVHISRIKNGTLHHPLNRDKSMARVMEHLRVGGFSGSLILEIDDLNFPSPLSSQEKVAVLLDDCAFMHMCMET